ncbi:MAG: hypothetical protein DCC58_11610 [Chloroflexi bacterium]|nr:MAG: hypothetical protein DCC58_11610 [Chloroflexota bacterium]
MPQRPTRLTPELLADLLLPSDPRVSPDGRWVAATVAPNARAGEHARSALWLASAAGAVAARQLTSGLAADSHPRWSPDSTRLAFLSDRVQRGTKQVHLLHLDGGEARALTDVPGGVADLTWLDDQRLLYTPIDAQDPEEEARRQRERDDAYVYGAFWPRAKLALLDLVTGATRPFDIGERHVSAFAPAPDGSRVALVLWPTPELDWWSAGGELAVLDLATGSTQRIGGPGLEVWDPQWSADGETIYFTSRGGATAVSSRQLFALEAQPGATPRLLTPDVPFCVSTITRPADWDDLLVLAPAGVGTNLLRFDAGSAALEPLIAFAHDVSGLSASADGRTVAAIVSTPTRPPEVYTANATETGGWQRVTDLHADLVDLELGDQEVLIWERAGLALDGILIWPPGKGPEDGPLPTLLSIHGGPYGRWAHGFSFNRFGRWLAQQGYLVLLPNPRGGQGHGQAFAESVLHTVGNEDYLDILAGLDVLIERGWADAERVGIGGWSQGGFMTAWAVGHTNRFKAGIMGAGVSDWGMMIATSDIPSYEILMGGGNPYEGAGPHSFDAQSPISYLSNVTTPVLVVHGEKDERVPLSQGTFFHRGLLRYGVPTELVVYPRESHGIQERQHQIDLAQRMADWFRRWIPV